jgi:class 3 adenylate cyclase/tetratricopeptide (TPR) repeat protein
MRCPRCQFENPVGAKYCLDCGTRQATVACRSCGTELPATARFCLVCGRPVAAPGDLVADGPAAPAGSARLAAATGEPGSGAAPRTGAPDAYTPRHLAERILTSRAALEGERKLVTVLFCDVTGSTAMAERLGAEAMHTLLSRFFDLAVAEVHRYEGTINQFLGDGFMALFGAPVAHEDHARRAVLAAWALKRRLARPLLADGESGAAGGVTFQVRMGINTGDVVVGRIGDNLRMDYTAIGDATNLAARLQQLAEPGTILLSESTTRLVRDDVRLEALPAVMVKGKSEPVAPNQLLGLAPGKSVLAPAGTRAAPFVGRTAELASLTARLSAAAGGHGHVVDVVGEAGMGKSRLLLEFFRSLDDASAAASVVLAARCVSHGSGVPYLPIVELVKQALGVLDADADETIVEKAQAGILASGLDATATPVLLRLLGIDAGVEGLESLSPEAIKRRTLDAVMQLVVGESGGPARLLVVEDLQWIDETSEELLTTLVGRLAERPVLLCLTQRTGYRPPWSEPADPARAWRTELAVGPLSPVDSLSLVHAVLRPAHLPDAVVADIVRKGDGNPLFLEELTRAAAQPGEAGATRSTPETIQGVLLARIDRLPEQPKQLLQTAAVLGPTFPFKVLQALWPGSGSGAGSGESLAAVVEELVQMDFLDARPDGDGGTYAFRHGLTQEVAYATLLTPRRHALHASAGRALEALVEAGADDLDDRLAYHYARADQPEKALFYLDRVAERAAAVYAHETAVGALEEALRQAERLPAETRERRRIELVLRLTQSLYFLGRSTRVMELVVEHEPTVERLADPGLAGRFHVILARTHALLGRQPAAAAAARRALEFAEQSGELATAGSAHQTLAYEAYSVGEARRGLEHAKKAAALFTASGERIWLGMAHWMAALNHMQLGEFDAALLAAGRCRSLGEALDDQRLLSYAGWVEAAVLSARGDREAAVPVGRRALADARDPFNVSLARAFLGFAYLELDPGRAIAHLEPAVREAHQFRFPQNEGLFMAFLSRAYFLSGNLEHAKDLAERAVALTRQSGFRFGLGQALRALGQVVQRRGARAEARGHLEESLQTFAAIESRFEEGLTHLALADLAHTEWNPAARGSHLRRAHDLFVATGAVAYVQRVADRAAEVGAPLEPRAA